MIYLNKNELKALTPQSQIFGVIGVLMNNPAKLLSDSVCLTKEDFSNSVHRIIFFAINNIVNESDKLEEITAIDIDTYLKQFEKYYSIFTGYKGIEYVQSAKESANEGMFKLNYHYIKKMTVLRKLLSSGIDISSVYDVYTEEPDKLSKQQDQLNAMTEQDIVNHFSKTISDIKNEVSDWEQNSESFDAGDDIEEMLENINQSPDFGYGFHDGLMNTITSGMQLGKLFLRSMKAGGGKTRLGLMDLVNVSATQIFNKNTGKWVTNENPQPSLFISTELSKKEIQLILICAVTRINPEVIKRGHYTNDVKNIINHGVKVLQETKLHFKEIQDFDIDDVMSTIDEYVFNYDVKYVDFDYIWAAPKLLRSGSELYGGRDTRDDRILLSFTDRLRNKAKELDIYIMSATQITPTYDDSNYEMSRTSQALRDSKSIADKIDFGMISADVTPRDLKSLEPLISDDAVNPYHLKPNIGNFCYKNRLGKKNIVIWSVVDLGTLHEYSLFATDYQYNYIDLPRTTIKIDNDGNYGVKEQLVF
ncbi:hypothetical protein HOS79_gp045 [Lactobacillus phage Nyseid]|uniref:DNA 5'-3' helicase n=1 Tax=Lactobacillus phage Nyseid TaxID=2079432 RepID=A0A2K9VC80_9CAUD|nr:hypothetical protein HOS79_gp045 [Lactobacillus phage Nyseid]AUV59805.1 hypothetical protein [Lactobacillus phage Nyseid]